MKKIKNSFFAIAHKIRHNPNRDWLILLCTFFTINLFLVGYLIFRYQETKELGLKPLDSRSSNLKLIESKKIKDVLEFYEHKKELFIMFSENPPGPPDPSN